MRTAKSERARLTLDPTERHGFEYQSWFGFTLYAEGVRGELGHEERRPRAHVARAVVGRRRHALAHLARGRDAAALEALKVRTAPVSGRWALVFSTQTARPKESAAKSIMDLPQEVSNAIYSVLFRVAPFLAGGQ